ncbi:hypothetical protein IJH33_00475 [Candidatus Saccharibacteria bacterium]|nr:hypothetical protein [Candidatus Saccharibacteria bacterium]
MNLIKKMAIGITMVLAFVAGIFGFSKTASAFSVTPMKQLISLTPGQEYTGEVTAFAPLDATGTTYYEASVVPLTVNDSNNNYSIVTTEMTDRTDIVNWVTLKTVNGETAENGVIKGSFGPGEQVNFTYTIKVPKDALGGGQYFAVGIVSVSNPNAGSEGTAVGIAERVAIYSVVYAEIAGDIVASGSISDNSTPSFVLEPKISASFVAKNDGNTHLRAVSYLQVFPFFSDEEVYTNEEDPTLTDVLPDTTRYIVQKWDGAPAVGIFKVRQTAYFESSSDNKSVMEKMVIICPIWLMVIALIVIVAIVVALIAFVKRSKNRKDSV